jgi:hypothetical protein
MATYVHLRGLYNFYKREWLLYFVPRLAYINKTLLLPHKSRPKFKFSDVQ